MQRTHNPGPESFSHGGKYSIPIREMKPSVAPSHEDEDPNTETNPRWKALKIKKAAYRQHHSDQQLVADAQAAFNEALSEFEDWEKTGHLGVMSWGGMPWPVFAPPDTIVPSDVTHERVVKFFEQLRDKLGRKDYKTAHLRMRLLFASDKWPARRSHLIPVDADLIVETMQIVYVALIEVNHETEEQEKDRRVRNVVRNVVNDRQAREAAGQTQRPSYHTSHDSHGYRDSTRRYNYP